LSSLFPQQFASLVCCLWLLAGVVGGCVRDSAAKTTVPVAAVHVWGERGTKPGEFYEPRAVAVAPNGFAYIVDSSGRIQKWTDDGKFIKAWIAPSIEKGRPEGVAVLKNGNVVITDTHYSKVRIYTPDGKLLRSFGRYGKQKGGFLLVTGICVDPDGNIFTCDYGGDFDRVSKWSPEGKLIASWSGHGEGPGQFRRPCGLAISREGDLLVADIGNHRVQRLDRFTGKCKSQSTLGPRGRSAGQLTYPYGVAVDKQGFIYTVEYGTHRVQKWSPQGKYIASWGGPGRAPGQLANPWGLAVDAQSNIYVADTQNHRVQKFRF
jgi:sugar lactone lactonase YvrE